MFRSKSKVLLSFKIGEIDDEYSKHGVLGRGRISNENLICS